MQGKNFLFDRSNLTRTTSPMLFDKSGFGQVKLPNVSTNMLPQFNFFDRQQFDKNPNTLLSATPPMEKKSIATPNAPIKNKTQSKKVDLKPKKLQYTEDELHTSSTLDSGIYIQSQSYDKLSCNPVGIKLHTCDSPKKQIYNLRIRLEKIKIQTNDKENDRRVLENTLNRGKKKSSPIALTQCDSDDWKDVLHWLQPRRDVGLWIECCREGCKKWRYTEDYHDPVDVPEIWYCEMNSDKLIANCSIPECPIPQGILNDLIENAYNAGSIVWCKINTYPWWPGIVNDCPETYQYYKLDTNSLQPIKYYVTFFNEDKIECAWVHKKNLKPFARTEYSKLIKKTVFYGIDYKSSLNKAYKMALSALPLSIFERLQKFSSLALYDKLYDDNNNIEEPVNKAIKRDVLSKIDITESDDEIIPASITSERNYLTCKEFCLNVVCKRPELLAKLPF